jgi:S1-C subfamily serine protease
MGIVLKEPVGAQLSGYGASFDSGGIALSEVPENGEAYQLGFRSGDLFQSINGKKVNTIQKFKEYIASQIYEPIKHRFEFIRNQEKLQLTIVQKLSEVVPVNR